MPLMATGADEILRQVPLNRFQSILDIGMGDGTASLHFAKNGKDVTGIGVSMESYNPILNSTEKINIHECDMNEFNKNYPSKKFDAIWASHVIEHTFNTGEFIEQCWGHLNDDGWLLLLTPINTNLVVGGHYMTGWNIGQIIYILAHFGFDTKNGNYLKYKASNVAFVQKSCHLKSKFSELKLRYDNGDFDQLRQLFFPTGLNEDQGDTFDGNIDRINWG